MASGSFEKGRQSAKLNLERENLKKIEYKEKFKSDTSEIKKLKNILLDHGIDTSIRWGGESYYLIFPKNCFSHTHRIIISVAKNEPELFSVRKGAAVSYKMVDKLNTSQIIEMFGYLFENGNIMEIKKRNIKDRKFIYTIVSIPLFFVIIIFLINIISKIK